MSLYVDGSAAIRVEEVPAYREPKSVNFREEGRKKRQQARIEEKRRKAKREAIVIRVVSGAILGVVILALAFIMLNSVVKNNALKNEISALETQLAEITAQNDSKEYDINSSVDMNEVIRVATEELGMVRSSAGQIITYDTSESEYIQQVAQVPGK